MKANRVSKIVLSAALVAAAGLTAGRAEAQHVSVGVGISLPPLAFPAPPMLVALPGSYVYAVPDYYDAEIFFVDGYWWRPWNGHWYRSAYYDHGWDVYTGVPYFYHSVPRDWRVRYHDRVWDGHPWNYEQVGYTDVQRNWSSWKRDRHWDRNWDRTREVRSDRDTTDRRDATRSDQRYRGDQSGSERRGEVKSNARERNAAPVQHRSDRSPGHATSPQRAEKSTGNVRSSGGGNRSATKVHSSGGASHGPSKARSSGGGGKSSQQHGGGGHGASQQHGGGNGGGGKGHAK
jgi:hypothetical protein